MNHHLAMAFVSFHLVRHLGQILHDLIWAFLTTAAEGSCDHHDDDDYPRGPTHFIIPFPVGAGAARFPRDVSVGHGHDQ